MIHRDCQKIALYGRSGSGKSLISHYLVKRYGFTRRSTGEICRKISAILFGDEQRKHLNALSEKIREIDSRLWIQAALRDVSDTKVIFESIRYAEDVGDLQSAGFEIWLVDCPEHICRERLRARGQDFDLSDLNHASENAIASDFPFDVIINNGDRDKELVWADVDRALETR